MLAQEADTAAVLDLGEIEDAAGNKANPPAVFTGIPIDNTAPDGDVQCAPDA